MNRKRGYRQEKVTKRQKTAEMGRWKNERRKANRMRKNMLNEERKKNRKEVTKTVKQWIKGRTKDWRHWEMNKKRERREVE